jgi:hypothetical protein
MEKYLITHCHMAHLIQNILFLHVFVILSWCILFHNGLKMNCHDVPFLFHPHVLSPLRSIRVSTMDISFICDSSCLPMGVRGEECDYWASSKQSISSTTSTTVIFKKIGYESLGKLFECL